jgi:hypothetical protein
VEKKIASKTKIKKEVEKLITGIEPMFLDYKTSTLPLS